MVLFEAFEKILTRTAINHRLSFPSEHLHLLPFESEVGFEVRPCGDEEHVWTFRCITRNAGSPRPVITKGWSDVVQEKHLQDGDRLKFYVDNEDGHPPQYRIMVERRGTLLMGAIIPNPDGNWHRIV